MGLLGQANRAREAARDPEARAIDGYWDTQGTELDLVAVDDTNKRIRFATCKRAPGKLLASLTTTEAHIQRFLQQRPHPDFAVEKVAIAPKVPAELKEQILQRGWLVEDLTTLTVDL